MKYKLIIDKNADEEIIAVVHAPSSLTQQIEDLICSYSGVEFIMGYKDEYCIVGSWRILATRTLAFFRNFSRIEASPEKFKHAAIWHIISGRIA